MSQKQRTDRVTADQISSLEPKDSPSEGVLGGIIRRKRRMLGWSLADLAERAGCTKSYLSAIETGRKGPPTRSIIERLEGALSMDPGELLAHARWDQTPSEIRADLETLRKRDQHARMLAKLLSLSAQRGTSLDELYASGALKSVIDRLDPEHAQTEEADGDTPQRGRDLSGIGAMLPTEVPVINKVTAGYPADFTDMGYPARTGDEYIRTPDLNDPDAFAARVVGDSMEPTSQEGDIVVFSPAKPVESGTDCFVRLEPDSQSTFKRVYFELDDSGNEMIRIQPINNAYPPRTVPREQVAGLYVGVSVIRSIG